MGDYLDVRTLSLTAGVVGVVVSALMVHASYRRKVYPGFGLWTAASILMALGFILISLRHVAPTFLSVPVANTMLVASAGLVASGLEEFAGHKRRIWPGLVVAAIIFAAFVVFTYARSSVPVRIVLISLAFAVLWLYSGTVVYRRVVTGSKRARLFLALVFGILTLWFLVRAVFTAAASGPIVDFMQASAYQGAAVLVFMGGAVALFVGLIILNAQRLEGDLQRAVGEIRTLSGLLPICASCKKIRNDDGGWDVLEVYIHDHSDAEFSHGLCPECAGKAWDDSGLGSSE